jgi:ABC-type uncharacterized transport system fused permease/ATPase subunit
MYQTLLRLGMNFVSVGHRSQLKAFHSRLLMIDGSGGHRFQELAPPESLHEKVDYFPEVTVASNSSSGAHNELAPINIEVSLSPGDRSMYDVYLRIAAFCFTQRGSLKNLLVHGIILILFVLSFINIVTYITPITSKSQLFQDTSASFIVQYLFFCVIIPAILDAVINSALAYVALRMRKNLTRGMEDACVRADFEKVCGFVLRNSRSRYFSNEAYRQ